MTDKHPGGRPSKYNPEYCEQIIELGKKGMHLYEIAMAFDVCSDTIYEWCHVHKEFSDAYNRAREYGKAFYMRDARENLGNKCYQPKLTEWCGKFANDFRKPPNIYLPEMQAAETIVEKAKVLIDCVMNNKINTEDAECIMNMLKCAITIEQEGELRPLVEELEGLIKNK